ncbi:MAG: hypothetical protein HFE97_06065 [Oscillospiraceae bacterium]|nr:hypothetical protein [Oscillospiraceae bacterium]
MKQNRTPDNSPRKKQSALLISLCRVAGYAAFVAALYCIFTKVLPLPFIVLLLLAGFILTTAAALLIHANTSVPPASKKKK